MEELHKYVEILKLYEPQISSELPKAQEGDRESALHILAVASGMMRAGLPLPGQLGQWLARGLEGLSAGMTAEQSFGFSRRKAGERTSTSRVRVSNERFRRAFLVEYFADRDGMSIEKACAAVAAIEHVSPDTVNAAWDTEHVRARFVLLTANGEVHWVREIK